MFSKALFTVVLLFFSLWAVAFCATTHTHNNNHFNPNGSYLAGIDQPLSGSNHFNAISSSAASSDCGLQRGQSETDADTSAKMDQVLSNLKQGRSVKFNLRHRSDGKRMDTKDSVVESTLRDLNRIQSFHRRMMEDKNQNSVSRGRYNNRHLLEQESVKSPFHGKLMGKLKSGVSLGSGEYFMDVLVGTPPKQFSLIVDTGSDLNWLQCLPCYDCFEQAGKVYDPKESNSFHNISCHDTRCHLVSSPDPPQACKVANQSCPYFYFYGDSSNTTGDFAAETFTVNITTPKGDSEFRKLKNVMFGCGHWNRGLFHGAAGLLGLGRGPLSFSSQIQSQYGHSFSYCLVDRYSGPNVSSKLFFGEDKDVMMTHPELNFTSLAAGKENPVDTFYYLQVQSVLVGGEAVDIPEETWRLSDDGGGGTIVDSGTTLSYFVEPAYKVIKEAFENKVKGYPLVKDFPVLAPCYNVSGSNHKEKKLELPGFGIRFMDGSQWNFPIQNHFIWVDQNVVCLAFLSVPHNSFSIIGNYQQQNFHVMYDTKRSRLGFAPARCAEM